MKNSKSYSLKFPQYFAGEKKNFLATVFLAVVVSYLVVSGKDMILFLFSGSLIGLFLFGKPVYCFWALFFSVFLMGSIVSHFPEITTLRWGVVVLALMLGVRTFLEFVVPAINQGSLKLDRLLLLVLFFFLIGFTSSLINHINLVNLLVALKNYFQFIPVAFALAILPHFKNQSIIKKIMTGLLIVAAIQIPMALYQRFILGEQAISMGLSMVAVQDAVSGTFANSLRGGASKALSLYLLFVISMMFSFAKHEIFSWRKSIFISIILFIPIVFNETKISFVYIPVVFAVIFQKEILRLRLKGIIPIALCAISILILGYIYKNVYTSSNQEFKSYINKSFEYNFGERGYGRYDLNRLTVLRFWIEESKKYDLPSLIIGHGLDTANEAEAGFFGDKGRMAVRYPNYGIGLTMVSRLLWETGVAGMVCFMAIFLTAFKRILRFLNDNSSHITAFHRSVLLGLQAGIVFCIIESFVSSAFRNQEVYNFLVSMILGLTLLMSQANIKQEK